MGVVHRVSAKIKTTENVSDGRSSDSSKFRTSENYTVHTECSYVDTSGSTRVMLLPLSLRYCILLAACLSRVLANTTCPTWQYYNNATRQCQCGFRLHCTAPGVVEIIQGHCATSAGNQYYHSGDCSFTHTVNNTNRMFSLMPHNPDLLDDVMCSYYNRKGLLCGECLEGFGVAIYSLDMKCANCSKFPLAYGATFYILLEFIPLSLFFIFTILFNINITSGSLLGYLFFCQLCTLAADSSKASKYIFNFSSSPYKPLLLTLLTLCRFWTMNWFFKSLIPPFCISGKLTGINVQMLRLVSVTYPIFLVIMTLFSWNCTQRTLEWLQCCGSRLVLFFKIQKSKQGAIVQLFMPYHHLLSYHI